MLACCESGVLLEFTLIVETDFSRIYVQVSKTVFIVTLSESEAIRTVFFVDIQNRIIKFPEK